MKSITVSWALSLVLRLEDITEQEENSSYGVISFHILYLCS